MSEKETDLKRREFVNGLAAISVSAALAPAGRLMAGEVAPAADANRHYRPEYPPGLSGLRGSHEGSFEVAHSLALNGGKWPSPERQTDPTYDLVVVGGGISGLTAASRYRQLAGDDARILILDNHDDFGGHAKRNEFTLDGQTLIGFGGSQTMQSPGDYSKGARELLEGLGVDVANFLEYFNQDYYRQHGAERTGVYFDKAHYGVDRVVASPFTAWFNYPTADPAVQLAEFPISEVARAQLLRLLKPDVDLLAGRTRAEKKRILATTSYEGFLRIYGKVNDEVVLLLRNLPTAADAVGYDALPASYAVYYEAPGTAGLGMGEEEPETEEPYIHHFPDGNAGVARLLVRQLIPQVLPGQTMEDIVLARANYDELDRPSNPTRIRLQSTAVNVAHSGAKDFVDVDYVQYGQTRRVRGKHVILAAYNQMIPSLCPELPAAQKEALAFQEKAPIVYNNVLLRNWRAFEKLGVNQVYSPQGFCNALWLDFPVSMGGYAFTSDPDQPILLHAVYSPNQPGQGLNMREQFRLGRREIYRLELSDYRRAIRDQLAGALGSAGFDPERDIAEITVNRWPHGYAYTYNSLYDDPSWSASGTGPHLAARAPHHRISIANSDSHANAYLDSAIDAGLRAVEEQLPAGKKGGVGRGFRPPSPAEGA